MAFITFKVSWKYSEQQICFANLSLGGEVVKSNIEYILFLYLKYVSPLINLLLSNKTHLSNFNSSVKKS